MSRIARTAFIVGGISAALVAGGSIILFRQTDMGRSAALASIVPPLAERARAAFAEDPTIGPSPTLGTRAWIEGPDGTIVARDLPWAAFALEEGQSLDPRIAPGPFTAVLEVTFRPRGDTLGRLGAALSGMRMILEQAGSNEDLHVDAAASFVRRSLTGEPVSVRTPVERLDYTLARTRSASASFQALRLPFPGQVTRPLPTAGRPLVALGPDGSPAAALEAWPPADDPFPIDALIGAIDLGRCTACHAFHARRPMPGTAGAGSAAPDLAAASLIRAIDELAVGMADCDDRARSIGLEVPELGPPNTAALATLLVQSAGRLPSAEAAAALAAEAEAEAEAAAVPASESDVATPPEPQDASP